MSNIKSTSATSQSAVENTNRIESSDLDARKAKLRWHFDQAHASARIEGHTLDPQYLADCETVISGVMTMDELRAKSAARAQATSGIATQASDHNDA